MRIKRRRLCDSRDESYAKVTRTKLMREKECDVIMLKREFRDGGEKRPTFFRGNCINTRHTDIIRNACFNIEFPTLSFSCLSLSEKR